MPNAMFQETLNYLYRELKSAKISKANAEKRKGATLTELVNINTKIEVLDGLIEMVLNTYVGEDDSVEGESNAVADV